MTTSRTRWAARLIVAQVLSAIGVGAAAQSKPGATLTLDAALELARSSSPVLRSATLGVTEAAGALTQAAVLLVDNPEIAVRGGRRSGPTGQDSFGTEFEVGLEQRLEVAGQRARRMNVAQAGVEVARADADDASRLVELAVATSFWEGLAAGERVALAEENENLAEGLLDVARRRVDAGLGTPLEINAATVRLAEARRLRLTAEAERRASITRLRSYLGAELPDGVTLEGELPEAGPVAIEEAVLERALAGRPDLRAEALRMEGAAAAARLAGAESWPDVSIMASMQREEGTDLLTAGLRIPLSLFNRNQGGRAAAAAARERATWEREAVALRVTADALTAVAFYEQARAAAELYDADVLVAMQETATLMQFAVEAGELPIADVLVIQAELLAGRLGYVEARLELATAGARLRAAVGIPQSTDIQEAIR